MVVIRSEDGWAGVSERISNYDNTRPVPRFAHFEILSLTHTRPPYAQDDGEHVAGLIAIDFRQNLLMVRGADDDGDSALDHFGESAFDLRFGA